MVLSTFWHFKVVELSSLMTVYYLIDGIKGKCSKSIPMKFFSVTK